MTTTHAIATQITDEQRQAAAARLYGAECALHTAHQTHVDAWITAAGDRLHEAVADYLATLADGWRDGAAGSARSAVGNTVTVEASR